MEKVTFQYDFLLKKERKGGTRQEEQHVQRTQSGKTIAYLGNRGRSI